MKLSQDEIKAAKAKLLTGVDRLHDAVDAGEGVQASAVKIARDLQLPAGQVRLLATAFNTARSAGARQGSLLSEKTAEFDLVDADAVIAELYPAHVPSASSVAKAASISDSYQDFPSWLETSPQHVAIKLEDLTSERLAEATELPELASRRLHAKRAALDDQRDTLYQRYYALRDKISAELLSLRDYFSREGSIPVNEVQTNCQLLHGQAAAPIFSKLAIAGNVSASRRRLSPVTPDQPPYSCVANILKLAEDYRLFFDEIEKFEKDAAAAEMTAYWQIAKPTPLPPDWTLSPVRLARGEKRAAAVVPPAAGSSSNFLGESILKRFMPQAAESRRNDAYSELTSPDHERRLRAIRAQAVMHSLLTSPYFEGENPHHVTDAFNQITKLSPRLIDNPIALESIMRRHMSQGQTDPHDLTQILDIEKGLKERDKLEDVRTFPITAPSLPR
jgi:hypothetical protein